MSYARSSVVGMDDLPARAVELRRSGLSVRQICERLGVPPRTAARWVSGLPVPAWTKRPNAKDHLRERAVELRAAGWSVPDLARELGVSRSTAWLWVRDHPLTPERLETAGQRRSAATRAAWGPRMAAVDARRQAAHAAAAARVGAMSEADLLRVGALIYWCEGAKAKPWSRKSEQVSFVNSDPGLIAIFLRFLDSAGVPEDNRRYRVSIHESVDVAGVVAWWAEFVGVPAERFQRSTLKRHNATTVRHNTGDGYRGCLVVSVVKCRELYWLIEGIAGAAIDECRRSKGPLG